MSDTSVLIHTWLADDGVRYRLISTLDYRREVSGYIIESCKTDALGGAAWSEFDRLPGKTFDAKRENRFIELMMARIVTELICERARLNGQLEALRGQIRDGVVGTGG